MADIKYNTDITNITSELQTALTALDDFEKNFRLNDKKLSDTSKWAGGAHGKCVEVHEAVRKYEQAIKPVCKSLNKLLNELTTNVSKF